MGDRARRYRSLVRRDGEACAHCGATDNLAIDHVIARSKGGSNRLENLQLLCVPCNTKKGSGPDERARAGARARRWRDVDPLQHLPECDGVFCMFGCPVFFAGSSAAVRVKR